MTWVSHTLSDRFWSSGLDLRTLPNYNCSHINKIHFLLMTYPLIILLLILRSFYWCISLVAQLVKNLPAMQETPVWFLGWEDSPREGIGYLLQYSWASLVAQLVKNLPAIWETWFNPWVEKIPWRREQLPTLVFWLGEFYGLYHPWGHKELDMTEDLHFHFYPLNKQELFESWMASVLRG